MPQMRAPAAQRANAIYSGFGDADASIGAHPSRCHTTPQVTRLIDRLIDALENALTAILRWGIRHLPMPARLRDGLLAKRQVLEEMVKFAIGGVFATAAFFLTFNIIGIFGNIAWWQALIIANIPAITVAYIISAHFVFDNNNEYSRRTEIALFFIMNAIAIAIGASALAIVEEVIGHDLTPLGANVITIISTVVSWGVRFTVSRRFIFKSHLDRPPVGIAEEMAHVAEELDDRPSGIGN